MALRSCGRETVAMMGPRARALSAPHVIGNGCFAPGSGCDVRRIWSVRFARCIQKVTLQNENGPPMRRAWLFSALQDQVPEAYNIAILASDTIPANCGICWAFADRATAAQLPGARE